MRSPLTVTLVAVGILLTFFGGVVTFEFIDTLTTIGNPPLEYWGFPLTAVGSIAGYWVLFASRNNPNLKLRIGLLILLLGSPIFDSFATAFFFEESELIRTIPFLGPIVNAFDLLSMPEFVDLYNVSFAAFPLFILVGLILFIVKSTQKRTSGQSCPNCGSPVKTTAAFCGTCGEKIGSGQTQKLNE